MLAAACLGAGLLAGCGSSGSLGAPEATAVTVEKVTITNAQVERMATFLGSGQDPTTGAPAELPKPDSDAFWALRAQAAQSLRDQAVFGILASRCGKPCAVSDKLVDTQIATIQQTQFSGSKADFEKTLTERGITLDDLKGLLRSGLQEQRLVARQQRGVTFTDAQARTYYDKNVAGEFTTPASKHLFHILVASKADAVALRAQATATNFSDLARSRSIDAEAKSTGGDLGPVNSPGLIPEIAAAASTLKPGVISQPIETQFGWHLLMVEARPATVTPFDKAKAGIISRQLQAARDAKVQEWRDTVVKKLQDTAVFANSRLAPEPPAATTSSTSSTSGAGTSTK